MSAAKDLISQFSDIQTLPHVVTHLSKLMADSESTIKQFEDVIKMDPILVVQLLKLVNSPFYGLVQKVDSISRAVAYLGMKNIHNIAVTEALKTIFTDKTTTSLFSRQKLWLHCAAVSICSKMVAERIFGINGDDTYLTGILHDFGLIVEEQVKGAELHEICKECSSNLNMLDLERKHFGTDHCEIGYQMTLEWNMPTHIQEAIRDHHTLLDDVRPESLTGILQIAEYLTSQHKYTTLEDLNVKISAPLMEHIQDNIDEYTVLIEDFPDEMANARDLYIGGTSG
ncbi:HDOD domain-containing protein [Desulfosediminicola flagellatus]|uniref:HDOD domain-containing protein n=1 Tax=Desulfosediminicola flagellatus TaxID=2569541 RepID=UPI0010AD3B46|nr:HDOD domain-containing protein [Desulfosediminicola flagellatus]